MKRILSIFLSLVLTAALLFGVVCIMAAGIGALGEQMLGLPVWLGAAIACVLIAAAARAATIPARSAAPMVITRRTLCSRSACT